MSDQLRPFQDWTINYVKKEMRAGNMTVEQASEFVRAFKDGLTLGQIIAWSARCCCYKGGGGHSQNSGRCGAREVYDPHRNPGEAAICAGCRKGCGVP